MVLTIEEFIEKYTLDDEQGNYAIENDTGTRVAFVALSEPESGIQIIEAKKFEENRAKIAKGLEQELKKIFHN